jgi:uncharacterized membrane protein YczE
MQALRYVSWLYIGTLVAASIALAVVAGTTEYGNRTGAGCNLYDALLYGVQCRGFFGAGLVEVFLGVPLVVGQVAALSVMSPWMLIPAALLFSPALFLGYCWLRAPRAT